MKLMSSSLALLGFSSCTRFRTPSEALPYVHPPAEVMPGERDFYATTLPFRGYGRGVVAECVMGRPVKLDGHPEHPSTQGGSDAAMQACLLELYDPDRPRTVRRNGKPSSFEAFTTYLEQGRDSAGTGLHIVTPHTHSPSLQNLIEERFPQAHWHRLASFPHPELREHYRLDRADLVLSLGLDFLGEHPNKVRLTRDFSKRREPSNMSKIWVYDSHPTLSKTAADHQGTLSPAEQNALLHRILANAPASAEEATLIRLLKSHLGRGLVMGGAGVDRALVDQANERWNNAGQTVTYSRDSLPPTSLAELKEALESGEVGLLLVLGIDPCYLSGDTLPIEQAAHSIHISYRPTLTAERCEWAVPGLHPLESWGDLRSYDGVASVVQPVIEPLTGGWSHYRLLSNLSGDFRSDLELVKSYWTGQGRDWKEGLASGIIDPTPWPETEFRPSTTPIPAVEEQLVEFRPDPYFHDGTAGGNPWLLELPRPITRLAWNNAVIVNQEWAEKQGLTQGDHLHLKTAFGEVTAPIFPTKDQANGVFCVTTGWGQTQAGRFGSGRGYDAFGLRGSREESFLPVAVQPVEGHTELISTQHHQQMEGRRLIRHGELEEWKKDPSLGIEPPPEESLYPETEPAARRWGMVIDLNKCIGCNACVTACGAENNLPVVGPEQTSRGRAMHWLRVDHYQDPRSSFLPVPCMHCENAPCEQVCPVEATLHSEEGLNQMVYNRCVGTRYCSNNCPYKVRRFNFFDYTNPEIEEWDMVRNPEVTVRSRGVMEKCTYCVQRIEAADIRSRIEEREIEEGEVVTACQAACPTRAIVFGDLGDPESEVSRLAALPHNYGLLAELNTRPRTTYLARLRNGEPGE